MKVNQKIAEQPYYMAFSHDYWDVQTHEAVTTGEAITVVKMPSTWMAYNDLKRKVQELEGMLFDAEHDE